MPYIDVYIAAEAVSEKTLKSLSSGITDIMVDILGKKRSLVAVSIHMISPGRWFIAGSPINPDRESTAFVTARITEETNTEGEKAHAIEAINQLLTAELGSLEEASYIVLQTIPAQDWGYSGQTQANRQQTVKRLKNGAIDTIYYLEKSRHIRSASMFASLQRLPVRFRRKTPREAPGAYLAR